MSNFNISEREKLIKLLTDQLELVEQITALCEKQGSMLGDEERLDELNASLDEAEKIRKKISGLHQEADVLMQSYVASTGVQKIPKKDDRIGSLAISIKEKTEICAKINEKNMSVLKSLLETQKVKIDEKSTQRKGVGGYIQAITNTSEMFDRKT